MKRKLCLMLALLLAGTLLIGNLGCRTLFSQLPPDPRIPYTGDRAELYTVAAYTMPDERTYAVDIEPIATDSFGRVLFRYNSLYTWSDEMFFDFIPDEPNAKSNKVSAYLILQKSDGQNAYYYDTICCQPYETSLGINEKQMTALKQANDWEQPMSEDKLVSRPITNPGNSQRWDNYNEPEVPWEDVLKTVYHVLHCDPNLVKVDFGTIDKDGSGHLLWIIMVQDKKEPQNTVSYFAITDESGYAPDENSFLKVSSLDYIDDLKQLKIRNHWAFTNQR